MFSAVNDNVRIPVAYYYISSLDAPEKVVLLQEILSAIIDCGVDILCVTFDGLRPNSALCRLMGANLDVYSDTFSPFFIHKDMRIGTIFDFSHTEKLVWNTLASVGTIRDGENKDINWKYYEQLVEFKDDRNYSLSHKLTKAHINYDSNSMNVKMAVQIFSKKTADSMEFLMNSGHKEFRNDAGTIQFTRKINDMYDICNSFAKGYAKDNPFKRPMSRENIQEISSFIDNVTEYIKGLRIYNDRRWVRLCDSTRKTGFVGYLADLKCLREIFNKIALENSYVENIATHTMSQDHVEIFFGKTRALNGHNNNPTCQQFDAALMKILANTMIPNSEHGNCLDLVKSSVYDPYSTISYVTSRRAIIKDSDESVHGEDIEIFMEQMAQIESVECGSRLTDLNNHTICQIAGVVH